MSSLTLANWKESTIEYKGWDDHKKKQWDQYIKSTDVFYYNSLSVDEKPKVGLFDDAEMKFLKECVEIIGTEYWGIIGWMTPGRTGADCELAWSKGQDKKKRRSSVAPRKRVRDETAAQDVEVPAPAPAVERETLRVWKQCSNARVEGIPVYQGGEEEGVLYLGNKASAINKKWMNSAGISAIVNVTKEIKNFYPKEFEYYKIAVSDSWETNINMHLSGAIRFIHKNLREGKSVLVHCQQGQSRSVTVTMAYLMRAKRKALMEIIEEFNEKEIYTNINDGFKQQLMNFEKKKLKKSSVDFFNYGKRRRSAVVSYSDGYGIKTSASGRKKRKLTKPEQPQIVVPELSIPEVETTSAPSVSEYPPSPRKSPAKSPRKSPRKIPTMRKIERSPSPTRDASPSRRAFSPSKRTLTPMPKRQSNPLKRLSPMKKIIPDIKALDKAFGGEEDIHKTPSKKNNIPRTPGRQPFVDISNTTEVPPSPAIVKSRPLTPRPNQPQENQEFVIPAEKLSSVKSRLFQ
eukprot:TRINITY_DN6975_c0_g1_i1.p1 TRINITY_DN6975_c0_g1~~TRINITY_DN6975_c0_g1_i1.p1  ORF type:complete len:516 (-),score=128.95 TRINITY_DN6975_c0_g1_i1:1360-2907(-)